MRKKIFPFQPHLSHLLVFMVFIWTGFFLLSCQLGTDDDDDDDVYIQPAIEISPGDIEQKLQYAAIAAPDLVDLRIIGYSAGNPSYPIYGLKITDNPGVEENEPEIQIVGGTHGDEQLSVIMVTKLIDYIINNYNTNPEITEIVNSSELHFFPVINPYGLARNQRYNANSVDLNRNFEWAWVNQLHHGNSSFDQPESRALRDDAIEHQYVISLSGHTGAAYMNTLWDYIGTEESTGEPSTYTTEDFITMYLPTYPFITTIASAYVNNVHTAGDPEIKLTEGYEWYPVYGSMQDWLYGQQGILAFTLEYYYSKNHDESDEALFNEVFNYYKQAFLDMFLSAQRGITGRVIDNSGNPVSAKVWVKNPELKASYTRTYTDPVEYIPFGYTDPDVGDYHIPIQPGTYDIEIEAQGFITQTLNNIIVPESDPWVINIDDIQMVAGKSESRSPLKPPVINPANIVPDLRQE